MMWIPALLAFAVATVAVAILMRARAVLPQALPNPRSLHAVPVARIGGVAWLAGAAAGALAAPAVAGFAGTAGVLVALALACVAAVSLLDDVRTVPALPRLAVHGAAGVLAAVGLAMAAPGLAWPLVALMALALAWAANLYNFMDGSDGLALLQAVLGFATYGMAALAGGHPAAGYACMAAAALPLLAVNRPPARMFMGDVGALPLGFLACAQGLGGVLAGAWPAWLPLLAFLPFIVDASLTLGLRLARGQRVWEAHNSHYYQRLNRLGAGHRGTLAAFGALAAATCATALACLAWAPGAGWAALGAWLALLALAFAAIDYHWRRAQPTP